MTGAARIALIVYGILLVAGGVVGWARSGSLPSLIAGSVSGVLAIVAALLSRRQPSFGFLLGGLVALAVGAMMGNRYLSTGAFMPAGMVAILSLVALVVVLLGVRAAFRSG